MSYLIPALRSFRKQTLYPAFSGKSYANHHPGYCERLNAPTLNQKKTRGKEKDAESMLIVQIMPF